MSTAIQARPRTSASESPYEYRWNWTYRLDHWVRVLAIAVLVVTGFYIHRPPTRFPGYEEGHWPELMSWMHFAHFVAGYVFALGLVVRVYRAFNSSFVADWRDFLSWQTLRDVPDCTLYFLFLRRKHKKWGRYDPLQALAYLLMAGVAVVQMLTGFALYHEYGSVFGLSADRFRWVRHLLGGDTKTRLVHYLGMWIFLVFVIVHVYMAAVVTWTHRDHSFRSIFTGYRLKSPED
jgi:Ni/Fe-hydrogenase 1 B-type cytochrome subunit